MPNGEYNQKWCAERHEKLDEVIGECKNDIRGVHTRIDKILVGILIVGVLGIANIILTLAEAGAGG